MDYPVEFRERVKAVFPNAPDLVLRMERGELIVGRMLDDAAAESIGPSRVLAALTLEELRVFARDLQAKKDLYSEWSRMAHEQNVLGFEL